MLTVRIVAVHPTFSLAETAFTVLILGAPRLSLSQDSFLFTATQAGSAPSPQTIRLLNSGTGGTLNWSIASGALNSAPWLNISPLSGAATAGTEGSSITLTINPTGLLPGVSQALIPVTTTGTAIDLRTFSVTLQILAPATPAKAEISPTGLVFIATQGGPTPPSQNLKISNTGGGILTYSFQSSGASWVSFTPNAGTLSSTPASVQVTANPSGLTPGIYRGKLIGMFSTGETLEVDVVLVVATGSTSLQRVLPDPAACGPQPMSIVGTTIGNGMTLAVSFPYTVLALVVDSCGASVDNALVTANIEGVPRQLQLVAGGLYTTTWTPQRQSAALSVTLAAAHTSYGTVQQSYSVSSSVAAGGQVLPLILPNGVVEAAGFTPLRPLVPGGIVSISGSRFTTGDTFATALPLPRSLNGVSVWIDGENAPLFYVGPNQIIAQVPLGTRVGERVGIVVNANGKLTGLQDYLTAPGQPGIFMGGSTAAVFDSQFRTITASHPAQIGDVLQILANGLGLTDPVAATGELSPPGSTVLRPVTATLGGVEVPVLYQGLATGFVGVHRVDVQLSSQVPKGDVIPLVIRQKGIISNPNSPVTIPIR
ncbi:MAG: hypothetical protein HY651_09165 [Acidobacteria bacterium]|nr:hypothetical protein [Acidobacteriota bacterium]